MGKNNKYGFRVFAQGEKITNDTRETGLNNNDLIIGTSGTGKTGGYVVPALQNICGSLVVSDTKCQLARRFRRELERKGYKVKVVDFVNPGDSDGYNPLRYIRRYEDNEYSEQDVLTIADILSPVESQRDPFWDKATAIYLTFLIAYCLETEKPEDQNMMRVCGLRRQFAQKDGDILFMDWIEDHKDGLAARKYYELRSWRDAEKTWSSIEGIMSSKLAPFDCRELKILLSKNDSIDIGSLGREKTVLFINQSDTNRAFDKIINLLNTQIMQVLCAEADKNDDGRLEVPVRLILDDFASGSTIPDFDKVISVIRSRDISVNLIIQSMTQLQSLYDEPTALTIINNCDNLLFLGGQDLSTAQYIAYRSDRTPEAILSMPRTKAYLIRSGEKARLVDKITPYSTLTKANDTQTEN